MWLRRIMDCISTRDSFFLIIGIMLMKNLCHYLLCPNQVKISLGVLGFPSLKTVLGMYFIEKEAALSNTGSNPLPTSVKLYSTLTGYSDTISLLIIPRCSSSRRRSVRTFGVMPSMFSINRLNCV
jgi:hypothetical protein